MIEPSFDDVDLAYETGVHFGDGCLSFRPRQTYRYALSGNRRTETQYYTTILLPLVRDLYDVSPHIYKYRNSIYLCVFSKQLVLFKHHRIGLPLGKKGDVRSLPDHVLQTDRSVGAFLAGFYDADGSIKIRRDKSGNYPRISIAQKSKRVIRHVKALLGDMFAIRSTMYRNEYFDWRVSKLEVRWFLDINGVANFARFLEGIGSCHPYALDRISRVTSSL